MFRTALVAIPATTAGQKVPVVFHLHGEKSIAHEKLVNFDIYRKWRPG